MPENAAGGQGRANRRRSTFWASRIVARRLGMGASGWGATPVARRMTRTLKRIKEALRRRMHHDVEDVAQWLGKVVNGWLNYFAVPNSTRYLRRFVLRLKRIWHHTLRRRSQKDRFSWVRLSPTHRRSTGRSWKSDTRGRVNESPSIRPEGGAPCLSGHAGICAGGFPVMGIPTARSGCGVICL